MNTPHTRFGRRVGKVWLAVLAAVLLVAGASWGSLAAGPAASEAPAVAAQAAPAAARALAGGRESYADIVKVVAPAVVTIRVEGQARDGTPTGKLVVRINGQWVEAGFAVGIAKAGTK